MGSVVKNSDKVRAKVLTGITVHNQESLTLATEQLKAINQPAIKARITTDFALQPGINNQAYCPPFQYPSIHDGIRLMTRNCYMGKADISRYFHTFPLAEDCRSFFKIRYKGKTYKYARCSFGFSACPV